MKKTYFLGLALLVTFLSFSQNNSINYKALVKDDQGNTLTNQNITIRFTIFVDASQVYQEIHNTDTDANGIAIVNIGAGTTSDIFSNIDWSGGTTSLRTEIDSGSGYVDIGTTDFKTVPYALYALNSSGFPSGDVTINGKLTVNENSINFTDHAVNGIKNHIGSVDNAGVYGENLVTDFYGYGVFGVAGYMGVRGQVTASGSGSYYGTYGGSFGSNTGTNYGIFGFASGGATNYAVYASGDLAYTGALINASDRKLKTNIETVNNALESIAQLNPTSYNIKQEYIKKMNMSSAPQIGFIAQELQEVFPNLVSTNIQPGKTKEDPIIEYLGVNYIGLIPILTAGIKEQQEIIEQQNETIEAQQLLLQDLLRRVEALENRD
ncbi:tail fiber domain-containing protein [Winogradskyella aquimaris]|uniref:Tail fiber domain-containing protein n=1 Tax=Winogradskyella aquimaris TaxID=864074 RepID=A0ABU5EUF6_9FLAO|nr:tail fiber domain-containing protein [Winogradskyella aquimaris]MDY2588347.1 tail fiber domain-containing protein [Winogradskyella aquimaris]